jgi:hypothetical protein
MLELELGISDMCYHKLIFCQIVYIFLLASTIGITIIFFCAIKWYNGIIDINALHNQSGWMYGEGWFETIMFAVFSVLGIVRLIYIKNYRS